MSSIRHADGCHVYRLFYHHVWDENGIQHSLFCLFVCLFVSFLCFGNNLVKTFEDLVVEFNIRICMYGRKYDYLMNGIYLNCFYNSKNLQEMSLMGFQLVLSRKSKF